MLVLSRKLGEKIYISDNICITVVDIDRGKIRMGIEAPRDVPIFRQALRAHLQAIVGQTPAAAAKRCTNCGNGIAKVSLRGSSHRMADNTHEDRRLVLLFGL